MQVLLEYDDVMVERRAIEQFVDRVVELFQPERVILFGSYASGVPTEDSDVDLLVVMNRRGPGHRLATKIRLAVNAGFPMDLLVRSETELRRAVKRKNWFTIDILETGITLYDAGDEAVGAKGRRRLGRRLAAKAVA